MYGNHDGVVLGPMAQAAEQIRRSWSTGGKIRVNTNQSAVSTDTVSLQANFPEAGLYTVQLDMKRPTSPAGTTFVCRAEATIEWFVAGNRITRKVSVGEGISISGTADGVQVTIRDTSTLTPGPPTDLEYFVVIGVSQGARASDGAPPCLEDTTGGPVLAGASQLFTIPLGAGADSVLITAADNTGAGTNLTNGDVLVQQKSAIAGGILKAYDARDYEFVPLSSAALFVLVTNLSAVSIAVSCTYGIDG